MTLFNIIGLVWLHFVADFVFQTDKMATRKSYDNKMLGLHCLVYSLCFLLFFGPVYALVNGALHFIVDYVTSRETSKLWRDGERHWFFVVIGLDQAVHMTMLMLSYCWIR